MNLTNNTFNDTKEVNTFTKKEILEIKDTLTKFKSKKAEEPEITEFIESKLNLSSNILNSYSTYLDEITIFLNEYIVSSEVDLNNKFYYHIKSGILKELNQIINNLQNLNSNCSNVKRLIKNGFVSLNNLLSNILDLLRQSNDIASKIITSLKETDKLYDDQLHLWIEINKIKNLNFKLNEIPEPLDKWVLRLFPVIEKHYKIKFSLSDILDARNTLIEQYGEYSWNWVKSPYFMTFELPIVRMTFKVQGGGESESLVFRYPRNYVDTQNVILLRLLSIYSRLIPYTSSGIWTADLSGL